MERSGEYEIDHVRKLVMKTRTPVEINRRGANKGSALAHLAGHLGLAPQEVMAIGDNRNDVTMLRYAGISVAMGNAQPVAQSAALYQAQTNDRDGAARFLQEYLGRCRA